MKRLKKPLCIFTLVFLCLSFIASPLLVYSKTLYEPTDSSGEITYYASDQKNIDKIFKVKIGDIINPIAWITDFRTYTLIKKNNNTGEYVALFNSPNMQSSVKNEIISGIKDGYTAETYDANDEERMVKVGIDEPNQNAITKYGFQIPNNKYEGEYPKETITIAGVNPMSWVGIFNPILAIFNGVYIAAPNSDTFNTITYHNHSYEDNSEYLNSFFRDYYLDYFERQIPRNIVIQHDGEYDYFSGPEEVLAMTVTDQAKNAAEEWNREHIAEYKEAVARYEYYNAYLSSGSAMSLRHMTTPVGHQGKSGLDFMVSLNRYKSHFESLRQSNPTVIDILSSVNGREAKETDYESVVEGILRNDDYMNKASIRYSYEVWTRHKKYKIAPDFNKLEQQGLGAFLGSIIQEDGFTDWKYSHTDEDTANYTEKDIIPFIVASKNSDENRLTDYRFKENLYVYDGFNTNKKVSLFEYEAVAPQVSLDAISYSEDDFVPTELQTIYRQFNANLDLIHRWELFQQYMSRGDAYDNPDKINEIYYRQCLITSDDDKCWSSSRGSNTRSSYSVVNTYVYSGVYGITLGYGPDQHQLSEVDANRILVKLKDYCGPYYGEVIQNMVKLMAATANYEGNKDPLKRIVFNDPRIMPYDTTTLLDSDKENLTTDDPRVTEYKQTLLGIGVASLGKMFSLPQMVQSYLGIIGNPNTINLILEWYKIPDKILSLSGFLTELSVELQQIISFDFLDNIGKGELSPAYLWTNTFAMLLMAGLAFFFIFSTVRTVFKMGARGGFKIILAFILLVIELGIITAIAADPQGVWGTIKNVESKIMNLGENVAVRSTQDMEYLFGENSDDEVNYYLPYLDAWSKYNTGYGLLDKEQYIDLDKNEPETKRINLPQIGGKDIRHWSVLLADSFSKYGESKSIISSIEYNGKLYNGAVINNNAYRVVDHFLAPRVDIQEEGGNKLSLSTSQNENYNGYFQEFSWDLVSKLMACALLLMMSIIKVCVFFWHWFLLYIFIFRVILGRGIENRPMREILLETFVPLLELFVIGLFSGIILQISMTISGILGILLFGFLFYLILGPILNWWHNNTKYFPKTLVWLYFITHYNKIKAQKGSDEIQEKTKSEIEDTTYWKEVLNRKLEDGEEEDPQHKNPFGNRKAEDISQMLMKGFNDDGTSVKDSKGNDFFGMYENEVKKPYRKTKAETLAYLQYNLDNFVRNDMNKNNTQGIEELKRRMERITETTMANDSSVTKEDIENAKKALMEENKNKWFSDNRDKTMTEMKGQRQGAKDDDIPPDNTVPPPTNTNNKQGSSNNVPPKNNYENDYKDGPDYVDEPDYKQGESDYQENSYNTSKGDTSSDNSSQTYNYTKTSTGYNFNSDKNEYEPQKKTLDEIKQESIEKNSPEPKKEMTQEDLDKANETFKQMSSARNVSATQLTNPKDINLQETSMSDINELMKNSKKSKKK